MIVSCSRLWPGEGVDPRNHWGALAGKLGFTKLDRPLLICLRGAELGATLTHNTIARVEYMDTGVLLYPDALTGAEPFVFRMASYPYQARSRASDDGDGDGDGDVATILPGHYVLTRAKTGDDPVWTMSTLDGKARIPCSRDLNHDGRIDVNEAARPFTASAILLHKGLKDGRSSIGCQTAMKESLHVIERAGKELDYVLVLANDAVALMSESDDGESEPPPPPEGVA